MAAAAAELDDAGRRDAGGCPGEARTTSGRWYRYGAADGKRVVAVERRQRGRNVTVPGSEAPPYSRAVASEGVHDDVDGDADLGRRRRQQRH